MKARVKIVLELEYELDPANYPGVVTPNEMLSIDLANMRDDPLVLLDGLDFDTFSVSGELLFDA